MAKEHHYRARLAWTGAADGPTGKDGAFSRAYRVEIAGKPPLLGSADPNYHGDPGAWNPEEMLLAALAACHMLTYLALCANARIAVVAYEDAPEGSVTLKDGRMRFVAATLRPRVSLGAGADRAKAEALHGAARDYCFIANSVNFPVHHAAEIREGALA
ncbi:MAG: OsmC family peroxiredoxin [Alphaproteobacteria bacterium]|nr:OsmC family peroxiredoxin [Alphaproteobacteria bacterium]